MAESIVTHSSLLVRLRDDRDHDAWRSFVDLYAPLLYSMARQRGLQDADAADVSQDVLAAVARAIKDLEYDPAKGSFRGWLYTVARNKLNDFRDRRQRQEQVGGAGTNQTLLEEQPAREEADWAKEYEQRLFRFAAEQVRGEVAPSTWQAFWSVAVEGKSGEEAANALGMSVGAVYVAKSRVLARVKQCIQELEGA